MYKFLQMSFQWEFNYNILLLKFLDYNHMDFLHV